MFAIEHLLDWILFVRSFCVYDLKYPRIKLEYNSNECKFNWNRFFCWLFVEFLLQSKTLNDFKYKNVHIMNRMEHVIVVPYSRKVANEKWECILHYLIQLDKLKFFHSFVWTMTIQKGKRAIIVISWNTVRWMQKHQYDMHYIHLSVEMK